MFMVKDELNNIKNLLKVRLKTQAKYFFWLFAVAAIVLAGSLSTTVFGILKNNEGFQRFNVIDFSIPLFAGIIVCLVIIMLMYRQNNAKLAVFPQTNSSRFISSLLVNYFIAAVTSLIVLTMYLLNLGVIKLLSAFRHNIHFLLNIDIGFIVAGFFVYLVYIFLIIAVIELVGAILRKWTYYAGVAFTAMLLLIIINIASVTEYAQNLLAFLIREPSLPLFFVKAIGLWLVITVASLIINRYTVYNKSKNKAAAKGVVIICVVVVAIVTVIAQAIIMYNLVTNDNYLLNEMETDYIKDDFLPSDEFRIDVSHLPRGSSIIIKGENFVNPSVTDIPDINIGAIVSGEEMLNNLQGDTVVIQFIPTSYTANGIEISQYTNPRLKAYLDGDMLILDYAVDSANIVFMPIWGFVRQFDCFKDKGVLPKHLFESSSAGNINSYIIINVE